MKEDSQTTDSAKYTSHNNNPAHAQIIFHSLSKTKHASFHVLKINTDESNSV
jgi:hypothetical protein